MRSTLIAAAAAVALSAACSGGGPDGVPSAFVYDSLEESLDTSEARTVEILDVFDLTLADMDAVYFRGNNCRSYEDWTYTVVTDRLDGGDLDKHLAELDTLIQGYGFPIVTSRAGDRADWNPEEGLDGHYAHIGLSFNEEDGDMYVKVTSGCSPIPDDDFDFTPYTARVG